MMTLMLKSLVLLFVTTALFTHSANADSVITETCVDDPEFEFIVTKDGQPKNCAWLKNKQIKEKVCQKERSKDGETKQSIATFCPYSCGECEKKKSVCPRKKPENGADCSKFQPGLTCDFNYRYTGGCGDEDSITCAPQENYTCSNSLNWEVVNFIEPSCASRRLSTVGEKCDPYECPSEPPQGGTACAKTGASCPYNYQYQGCSIISGLECKPSIETICNEDLEWEMPRLTKLCSGPTDDQDPLIAEGISCTPGPTVEPEGICPSEKPNAGENCSIDATIECKYEFKPYGCSTDDIRYEPQRSLFCLQDKWVETPIRSDFVRSCPFTCPQSKPTENAKCTTSTYSVGHQSGLSCDYEYKNTSCRQGATICTPTENYICDSTTEDVWERTSITNERCPAPPSHYYEACEANQRRGLLRRQSRF